MATKKGLRLVIRGMKRGKTKQKFEKLPPGSVALIRFFGEPEELNQYVFNATRYWLKSICKTQLDANKKAKRERKKGQLVQVRLTDYGYGVYVFPRPQPYVFGPYGYQIHEEEMKRGLIKELKAQKEPSFLKQKIPKEIKRAIGMEKTQIPKELRK